MGRKFNTKNLQKNDNEKVKVTVALPVGLVKRLIRAADQNKRNLSNMIETILDDMVEGYEEGGEK